MRPCRLPISIVFFSFALAGCSDYQPAPGRSQPPAPLSPAAAGAKVSAPTASPIGGMPAAPVAPTPTGPTQAPPSAAPASTMQPEVRLSAGVALPQTLPEGSVMTFSVDYEFLAGKGPSSPSSQNRYVLVIQPPQGQAARIAVQLKTKDTLMWISNWPPSSRPFRAHLEDQSGRKVSEAIDLR